MIHMHTKILKRKYFGKEQRGRLEVLQTHWFYLLPSIMFNFINLGEKVVRFSWLLLEIEYAWNIRIPGDCGNTRSENLNKEKADELHEKLVKGVQGM